MKDLLKKPLTFEKIEFWVVTFIYASLLYMLAYNLFVLVSTGSLETPLGNRFRANGVRYSHLQNYFIPSFFSITVYYGSFLLLNFYLVKNLIAGKRVLLNIILILTLLIIVVVLLGTISTWMKCYLFSQHGEEYVYRRLFKEQLITTIWATLLFVFYTAAKYSLIYLYKTFYKTADISQSTRECIVALGIWFLSIFFLIMTPFSWRLLVGWAEVSLFALALYWFLYQHIIPQVMADDQLLTTFLIKVFIVLVLSFFPVAILVYVLLNRIEAAVIINMLNAGVGLFIVAPFAWFLYRHRLQKSAELMGLKTALNQSSANVDFLRSQINPHFLFNALNTLYATAIQESADRTGEGIQKLGDMMRFMLQENVQEQISLMREVDYLNNYIALQKLRTQTSPDIVIQTEIEDQLNGLQIAPMLLIPFVENAFKHGISLRQPSHIKITLNTRGTQLFFDMYNSTHAKPDNDPEQNKSGIGLENVKQRLQLVYPARHELVIRESAKEFFVHLTLNLN